MSYTKLALELERKRLDNLKKYVSNQMPKYQKEGTLIEMISPEQSALHSFKTIPYVIKFFKFGEENFGVWEFSIIDIDSESHEIYVNNLYDVVSNSTEKSIMSGTSELAKILNDRNVEIVLPIDKNRELINRLHQAVVESNCEPIQNISYQEVSDIAGNTKEQTITYNSYSQSSQQIHSLATLDLIDDKINICSHDMVIIPAEVIEEFLSKQEILEPRDLSKINGFYDYNKKLKNSTSFLDEGIAKIYNKK